MSCEVYQIINLQNYAPLVQKLDCEGPPFNNPSNWTFSHREMRLTVKRNSQANRLSALFKGRRASASDKQTTDNDAERTADTFSIQKESTCFTSEELSLFHNSNRVKETEYLTVLNRILQEQIINTTEVYNIAGKMIRVEVLEDTEL